jgi:DNA-binding protein YbaB
MVEDLILAAIRDVQERARARNDQEMNKLAEVMGMPPGMKLPF